jgi:hypothetical protein
MIFSWKYELLAICLFMYLIKTSGNNRIIKSVFCQKDFREIKKRGRDCFFPLEFRLICVDSLCYCYAAARGYAAGALYGRRGDRTHMASVHIGEGIRIGKIAVCIRGGSDEEIAIIRKGQGLASHPSIQSGCAGGYGFVVFVPECGELE